MDQLLNGNDVDTNVPIIKLSDSIIRQLGKLEKFILKDKKYVYNGSGKY